LTSGIDVSSAACSLAEAPVLRFDVRGRVRYWNETAMLLFALSEGAAPDLWELLPELPRFEPSQIIANGEHRRCTLRIQHHPCTIAMFGIPELNEGVLCLHEHWHSPFLNDFLSRLTAIGMASGRPEFFDILAENLGAMLEVPFVLVGELTGYPLRKLRTLAIRSSGEPMDRREFILSRSFSERILRSGPAVVSIAEGVTTEFPADALIHEMGIQSASGVAILARAGEPVGVIAAMHTSPWQPQAIDEHLLRLFAAYASAEINRKHGDREMQFLVTDLRQRMRELSCFYGLLESIRTRETLDEICQDLAGLLPEAWQHPEIARARIIIDGNAFVREAFNDSSWGMSSAVIANGRARGMVQMFYMEDRSSEELGGPFLAAERNLLDAIARILGEAIQRREVEAEIREKSASLAHERNRLEMILRNIGDGVVVTDADNAVLLMNRAALHLLGCVDGEPIGEDFLGLLQDKAFQTLWRDTAEQHAPLVREEMTIREPEPRTVAMTRNEIPDLAHGRPGHVTIMHDVTKERDIDRMKSDFVSSVSHELRTPMTSIKGFVHTLLRKPDIPPEKARHFLTIISQESDRLLGLIEDLLTISRIEAGALQLERRAVHLQRELERAAESIEPQRVKKSLSISIDVDEGVRAVRADPEKLYAVLLNLLDNAIKFTPDNGAVTLAAKRTSRGVEISVQDTGIGIPESELERVFERFYRVQRPNEEHAGTGLGLFIVKQIIEQHGGTIEAESVVGKGTRFTIVLPGETRAAEAKEST